MQTLFILISVAFALYVALIVFLHRKSGFNARAVLRLLRTEEMKWVPCVSDGDDILSSKSLMIRRIGKFGSMDEKIFASLQSSSPLDPASHLIFEYRDFEPVTGGVDAEAIRIAVRELLVAAKSPNVIEPDDDDVKR